MTQPRQALGLRVPIVIFLCAFLFPRIAESADPPPPTMFHRGYEVWLTNRDAAAYDAIIHQRRIVGDLWPIQKLRGGIFVDFAGGSEGLFAGHLRELGVHAYTFDLQPPAKLGGAYYKQGSLLEPITGFKPGSVKHGTMIYGPLSYTNAFTPAERNAILRNLASVTEEYGDLLIGPLRVPHADWIAEGLPGTGWTVIKQGFGDGWQGGWILLKKQTSADAAVGGLRSLPRYPVPPAGGSIGGLQPVPRSAWGTAGRIALGGLDVVGKASLAVDAAQGVTMPAWLAMSFRQKVSGEMANQVNTAIASSRRDVQQAALAYPLAVTYVGTETRLPERYVARTCAGGIADEPGYLDNLVRFMANQEMPTLASCGGDRSRYILLLNAWRRAHPTPDDLGWGALAAGAQTGGAMGCVGARRR